MKMYYKIVHQPNLNVDEYYSCIVGNREFKLNQDIVNLPYRTRYILNEWTYFDEDNPGMVFKTINDVCSFLYNTFYENRFPETIKTFPCEIVESIYKPRNVGRILWPHNTVFAQAIKIMKDDDDVL